MYDEKKKVILVINKLDFNAWLNIEANSFLLKDTVIQQYCFQLFILYMFVGILHLCDFQDYEFKQ